MKADNMSRKIFAIAAFAFAGLFFNACDGGIDSNCGCGIEGDIDIPYPYNPCELSQEDDETGTAITCESFKKLTEEISNDYCPTRSLPFPASTIDYSTIDTIMHSDGSIEIHGPSVRSYPYSAFMNHYAMCDEADSIQVAVGWLKNSGGHIYYDSSMYSIPNPTKNLFSADSQEIYDVWREEVCRMRSDSARTAELTFSDNQTIIHLSSVFLDNVPGFFQLKDSKKNDTLYIDIAEYYIKKDNIDTCPVSVDITINHVDEDIAVIVFEKYQFFQVKRE
jgi:hypothetical protein